MTEKTAQKEPGKKPVPSKKPKPQQEVVVQISLSELHPFPDHPFQVRSEEHTSELQSLFTISYGRIIDRKSTRLNSSHSSQSRMPYHSHV